METRTVELRDALLEWLKGELIPATAIDDRTATAAVTFALASLLGHASLRLSDTETEELLENVHHATVRHVELYRRMHSSS